MPVPAGANVGVDQARTGQWGSDCVAMHKEGSGGVPISVRMVVKAVTMARGVGASRATRVLCGCDDGEDRRVLVAGRKGILRRRKRREDQGAVGDGGYVHATPSGGARAGVGGGSGSTSRGPWHFGQRLRSIPVSVRKRSRQEGGEASAGASWPEASFDAGVNEEAFSLRAARAAASLVFTLPAARRP